MSNSPWRRGLMNADPGKWRDMPGEVSPRRQPTWAPLKEEPVPDATHRPVRYAPVHTPPVPKAK